MMESRKSPQLLTDIRHCREYGAELPHGPRPVMAASRSSQTLILGQVPGRRCDETGFP